MENRFEKHKTMVILLFFIFLLISVEVVLSLSQFARYKKDIKAYYVTPILRPMVNFIFKNEDYVPRTLSMYTWPWDYKTDRARPGHHINPLEPTMPAFNINSFGLRGKEFQIPKPKGTYRIVVYGGSSTFGSESTDEETYPAQLEKKLQHEGYKNVEVLNYGAHGKSLYWIAQQYFNEVEKIQPDLIVINSIRNTFFDQLQRWTPYTDIVSPQKAIFLKTHLYLTDNFLFYRFLRKFIEKAQYTGNIKHYLKEKRDRDRADGGQVNGIFPEFFEKTYPTAIGDIYVDAAKRGIGFMLVIEPIRCVETDGATCMWNNVTNKVPMYYDVFRGAIKKVQEKHKGLIVLDPVEDMIKLADRQGEKQNIFYDVLHLTPQGNVVLSNLIASRIMDEKLLPNSK